MTNGLIWSDDDSALYRQLAQIAVPARAEQLATLLTLIPFTGDERFHVVELASGEGFLSEAILTAFPQATITALDFEASMREATATRLTSYGERATVAEFDIQQDDWFEHLDGAHLVVSSLCIHHLDEQSKQHLFNAVQSRIDPRGALLIADLVLPVTGQARELFAASWDRMAEAASIQTTMQRELFELFVQEQWNYYRYPDDFDKPSPLYNQLRWLSAAGFSLVDVWWMQAGHAIYGGYQRASASGIPFEDALQIAHQTLKQDS